MKFVYKDERIRSLMEDDVEFTKRYGKAAKKKRDRRLNEIENYDNVAELLRLGSNGPGRWHVLDGRNRGQDLGKISGDLSGNLRLLLSPIETPYGTTVEVEISEFKDTHK